MTMATAPHPLIGCPLSELDTPVLIVELDALERNIAHIAEICRQRGIQWRPHCKAHKSPEIARRQLASGAIGLTCAKLGEAEVMAAAGIRDLLVANQVVGPVKMRRLAALSRLADPIIAVDHPQQIDLLERAMTEAGTKVRVLVEVDLGLERAGVAPGEAALELARRVAQCRGLRFAGIMGYEGHLLTLPDLAEKQRRITAALSELVATRDLIQAAGLACGIVSAGGTGSYMFTAGFAGITELQAGGLIFMDAFYADDCQVREFEYALKVLTTVVSRPARHRAIVDAGRKSIHGEVHCPLVAGRDDIHVEQLSAEHGWLRLDDSATDLQIGDRLELIPGYGDFTCVLHDEFLAIRNGKVEAVWPLVARGRMR
jgi:D-serine deaminase-like pyridoxal phosphate-dependent protein